MNRFRPRSARLPYLALGLFLCILFWLNRDLLLNFPPFK
jgi:hypothetical protein